MTGLPVRPLRPRAVYRRKRPPIETAGCGLGRAPVCSSPTRILSAYVRLVDADRVQTWDGRGHFFAAAAEAMRRILIDRARRRQSQRRGGDKRRVGLDAGALLAPVDDHAAENLLASLKP